MAKWVKVLTNKKSQHTNL